MSISKKLRFEVFKRDNFTCAYCGKTPPEVVLEIDHICPKSKGGEDDINNLITACYDCNRGKGNTFLDKIPNKITENLEILKEKEEQLKEYRKYIAKRNKRINDDIDKIELIFQECYPNRIFNKKFREATLKRFLTQYFTVEDLIEYMAIACNSIAKNNNPEEVVRYFCGICWNKIREKGNKNNE